MDATVFFQALRHTSCAAGGDMQWPEKGKKMRMHQTEGLNNSLGRGLKHVFFFNPIPWGNDPT